MTKRISFILAAVCGLAALGFSQGVIVPPQTALKTVNGITAPIAGASITVCAVNTGGIPCSPALSNAVFRDAALTQPLSNPFAADSNGNYNFAIAPGNYTVTVTALGFSGYSYQVSAGNGTAPPSTITLQTNGSNNTLQNLLNQIAGNGVSLTNTGGGVTFQNTGALSFNGRTGVIISQLGDITSPFSGTCNNTTFLRGDGQCAAASAPVSSVFGRTGAVTAQSGDYTWDLIGAGSNLFAQSMGTGGSLSPLNLGQVAGSQTWARPGIVAPVLATGAGGSLPNAHGIHVVVTYNTSLGETLPSIEATIATLAGSSAITVTAPTLPAGYTGFTVYDYDANAGGPTTWQKQTSTPNCVNIVTNCVITNSNVATSGVPTSVSAWVPPPNVQATNGPLGWIPTLYFPKTDGNYYPWLGVEVNSCDAVNGPPLPCGTPMFTHRTWFADNPANTPVGGRNAFVVIDHTAGIGTVPTNQDRALWVNNQNPANDAAARYAIEGIQDELDFNCNGCSINGSPDGEVTAGSFQLTTAGASTNWSPAGYSTNAVQGRVFRNGAGFDNTGISAIYGNAANNNATAAAGSTLIGLRSNISSNVSAPNMTGHLIDLGAPSNTNFGIIRGIFANGGFTPRATDHFIDQRVHNWNSYLNGNVNLTGVSNSDEQSLPVSASLNDSGSVAVSQVPSSWLPGQASVSTTIGCSGGASGYNYQMVCVDGNGGQAPGSVINTASTCVNPLTSGNPATITTGLTSGTDIRGMCTRLDVYRVGGPMATGKIGSLSLNSNFPINGMNSFVDTGLAATTPVPAVNTTGGIAAAGYVQEQMNTVRVGSSGFTTAANTSLQTITGLSWNLDSGAKNYSFTCHIAYSQATANAAVAFGIQAATNAPTNIFAKGSQQITVGPPATFVTNTLATLNTTTATTIVSGTPGATATNFIADLDGSIEEAANTNGNVVNVMVSTATSGDAVTVLRGSYCQLF